MKRNLKIIGYLISGFVTLIWCVPTVNATAIQISGLSVSPAIEQLNLTVNQQTASFNCLITNNTNTTLKLTYSAQDFTALNNTSGSISFLPNSSPSTTYGLAEWIRFGVNETILAPKGSQIVPVTIINTEDLSPGGHYAAVKFTATSPLSSVSGDSFTANEVVSTLVFLTTSGHVIQAVKLKPLQLPWLTLQIPTSIHLVFDNIGNTQTVPQGLVTITSPSHSNIAKGPINIGSGLVLPATSRLYTVSLISEQTFNYPGIYNMKVSYQPAGSQSITTITKHFLYINEPLFIAVGAIIVIALLWIIRRYGLRQIYRMRRQA
jgi:hypothetical protein